MKNLSIGIIVLLVALGGMWLVTYFIGGPEEMCAQVITDARNPETGEVVSYPTPCDVPEGCDVLESDGNQTYTDNGITYQRYWNADLGLSFAYRIEPDGYTFLEQPTGELAGDADLEKNFLIVNTAEYAELLKSDIPREGPPAISVMVFKNEEGIPAEEWITEHDSVSNFREDFELTDVTMGGVSGVRYMADGLYQFDIVVLQNNFRIYIIAGAFSAPNDAVRTDFLALLETVELF